MSQVNIDDKVYDEIKQFVENNNIEYPSVKNFIDRQLKRIIEELK